jgi:hypothetical protein
MHLIFILPASDVAKEWGDMKANRRYGSPFVQRSNKNPGQRARNAKALTP